MFYFLFGWMFGRGVRNAGLPDTVKQANYDRRARNRAKNRQFMVPLFLMCAAAIIIGAIFKG